MKKITFALFAYVLMMGGMSGAHQLQGKDWGQAVSALAQSEPGAVANHIQMQKAL